MAGERAVLASAPSQRSSARRGSTARRRAGKGGNFVETMLAKGIRGEAISVVDDQISSPTATRDLADRLLLLLEEDVPGGVYHVTNAGRCSWYELAREALRLAGVGADLTPVKTDPNAEVRRPSFSAMIDTSEWRSGSRLCAAGRTRWRGTWRSAARGAEEPRPHALRPRKRARTASRTTRSSASIPSSVVAVT